MPGSVARAAAGIALAALAGSCSPGAPKAPVSLYSNILTGRVTLPVDRWVLSEGIEVEAASFCPPPSCDTPSAVFVLQAKGPVAGRLKAQLASDAALSRRPAPPRTRLIGGGTRIERGRLKAETRVSRSQHHGLDLTRVVLAPRSGPGPEAHIAILMQEQGDALRLAWAVSADEALSLAQAMAAIGAR